MAGDRRGQVIRDGGARQRARSPASARASRGCARRWTGTPRSRETPRTTASIAAGYTFTPRTFTMSSARARIPPSSRAQRAAARARLGAAHDEVAGAIADQRARRAAEVRHHQLAAAAVRDGPLRLGVDHLAEEAALVEVQEAGRLPALEADGPDLGQAVVVDHAGAPGLLDARARRGDAAARLAGDDQHAHAALAQADALGGRHLGEVQRVGRRAADDRGVECSRAATAARRWSCRRRGGSARRAGRPRRRRSRSRGTARTRTGRTRGRRAPRAPRGRRSSSTRAATASSRWCRASAAAGRWWTRSGSSGCSGRAAR